MISQYNTYFMGATLLNVGLSQTVNVNLQRLKCVNGAFFKIVSGGGTLAIVNGASSISTQGYPVGSTEVVSIQGPASFFLAAAGATMVVGLALSYSQGFSQTPGI